MAFGIDDTLMAAAAGIIVRMIRKRHRCDGSATEPVGPDHVLTDVLSSRRSSEKEGPLTREVKPSLTGQLAETAESYANKSHLSIAPNKIVYIGEL